MRAFYRRLTISSLFFLNLLQIVLFVPKCRPALAPNATLIVAICLMEALYLLATWWARRRDGSPTAAFDIILLVWVFLTAWELATSVFHIAHPVLFPAPENVFNTFREHWNTLLLNVWYSLRLLAVGFTTGLVLAVILGLFAGWFERLRAFACPIANVMAPIPAIVISPYLVSLMPSFRSASILVIVLGVFWPTFLNTINRVTGIEPQILDSARMLKPSNTTMIWRILLPCLFPGVIAGLKVNLTTSLLMLNFAELMGATHGMGYYVQNSIAYANYAHAVAGIIVIGVVVTILNALVGWLQKKLIRWR